MAVYVLQFDQSSARFFAGQIGSAQISAGGVASTNIASGSVGTPHIAAAAIASAQVASGAIGGAHIANQGLISANYAAGSIASAHIASGTLGGGTTGVTTYSANAQETNVLSGTEARFFNTTIISGQTMTIVAAGISPSAIVSHMVEVYSLTTSTSIFRTTSAWFAGASLATVGSGNIVFRLNNRGLSGTLPSMGFVAYTLA